MCELDRWIAEKVFKKRIYRKGDRISLPTESSVLVAWIEGENEGIVLADQSPSVLPYSTEPCAFAAVKREIERRGWSWQAHSPTHSNGYYWFAIFAAPDHSLARIIHKIGEGIGDTEEMAGCLALKAAIESENAN